MTVGFLKLSICVCVCVCVCVWQLCKDSQKILFKSICRKHCYYYLFKSWLYLQLGYLFHSNTFSHLMLREVCLLFIFSLVNQFLTLSFSVVYILFYLFPLFSCYFLLLFFQLLRFYSYFINFQHIFIFNVFMTINLPSRTAFTAFHIFVYVVFFVCLFVIKILVWSNFTVTEKLQEYQSSCLLSFDKQKCYLSNHLYQYGHMEFLKYFGGYNPIL